LWLPELARAIAEATAFVLLIGEKGIGPWQVIEYYEALDRRVKEHDFPVVLILLEGQAAPGLLFLRQLHWVISADPASEQSLAQLMDAASGDGAPAGELWRHMAPYLCHDESDAGFFFGRGRETVEVITALAAEANKLPILLGNSGVGKSSLAQAGVVAALMRQGGPMGRRLAARIRRKPPLVLPQAQARHRADAGCCRNIRADLAARRSRSGVGETHRKVGPRPCRWGGLVAQSSERDAGALPRQASFARAVGFSYLHRPGRRAFCPCRSARASSFRKF
jgi:hypothetical protein